MSFVFCTVAKIFESCYWKNPANSKCIFSFARLLSILTLTKSFAGIFVLQYIPIGITVVFLFVSGSLRVQPPVPRTILTSVCQKKVSSHTYSKASVNVDKTVQPFRTPFFGLKKSLQYCIGIDLPLTTINFFSEQTLPATVSSLE